MLFVLFSFFYLDSIRVSFPFLFLDDVDIENTPSIWFSSCSCSFFSLLCFCFFFLYLFVLWLFGVHQETNMKSNINHSHTFSLYVISYFCSLIVAIASWQTTLSVFCSYSCLIVFYTIMSDIHTKQNQQTYCSFSFFFSFFCSFLWLKYKTKTWMVNSH